jgi:uncharacterized protein YciI
VFLLINTYTDLDRREELQAVHREWFDEQCRLGPVVLAGRQVPVVGGVIVVDLPTRQDAEAFAAADPFAQGGAATYEIIEFTAAVAYPDRLPS